MQSDISKDPTEIGGNRTGISLSPIDGKKLIQGSADAVPSQEGDDTDLMLLRGAYISEATPTGTMPPPANLKGAVKSVTKAAKNDRQTVLLDKLGERLAFERTGARLYEALIQKVEASSKEPDMATKHLRKIHREECMHFDLLMQTIKEVGGDPTAVTPCANVSAVSSMGLLQVLTDPRTTVTQCLNSMLIAEAADNEGWTLLVELARSMGEEELANRFEECEQTEREHLNFIRSLLKELVLSHATKRGPTI